MAKAFVHKNSKHIYKAHEFKIQDLRVDDFMHQCKQDIDTAPGLDGWAAKDLELLSKQAFRLIVVLLNVIEQDNYEPKGLFGK